MTIDKGAGEPHSALVDIGKPERIIHVEPIDDPVPRREIPAEPSPSREAPVEPSPEPVPAA